MFTTVNQCMSYVRNAPSSHAMRKTLSYLSLVCTIILSASPAYAEDTEIYFADNEGAGQANIMMMLDTSGSMGWCSDPDSTSRCDPASNSRIAELKRSFTSLMDGLGSNISMGLGRLSDDDGGYIIHPVMPIDDPLTALVANANVDSPLDDANQSSDDSTDLHVTDNVTYFPSGGGAGGRTGLIFRNLSVPRYSEITSATITVQASGASSVPLDVNGNYEVGEDLPSFAVSSVFNRNWAEQTLGIWNSPVQFSIPASQTWADGQTYEIDVTTLFQKADNETAWCGGLDIAFGFENTTLIADYRAIVAADSVDEGNDKIGPSIEVEWAPSSTLTPSGTPGTPPYEASLACMGARGIGLADANNDAEQEGAQVHLDNNRIAIDNNNIGAFRFPDVTFDSSDPSAPDIINEATLTLTGVRAQLSECTRIVRDRCRRTEEFDLTDGFITLRITGVAGSAAEIRDNNRNISSRTVVTERIDYLTSAAATDFNAQHSFDVTAMIEEMMASGWNSGGALMFIVEALDAEDRFFALGSQDSGSANAATLSMSVSTADPGKTIPRVRDRLKDIVNALSADDWTPLGEAYSEMSRYMMGLDLDYGTGLSVPESYSGSSYISPISDTTQECASNHIIVMTDGKPSYDGQADEKIEALTGTDLTGVQDSRTASDRQKLCDLVESTDSSESSNHTDKALACMEELAEWNMDSTANNAEREVHTHMILFHLDADTEALAKKVTDSGQGMAVSASDQDSLQEAFASIINSITVQSGTLAAPGVAVNRFNRLRHLDQLYYSMFKPSTTSRWGGNMKRYRLDFDSADTNIVDENDVIAVDPGTGFFKETSNSWWGETDGSDPADGADVAEGGAREELANRTLYIPSSTPVAGGSATSLTLPVGAESNTLILDANTAPEVLGMSAGSSADEINTRIDFLLTAWGDPLHGEPKLVNYGILGTATVEEATANADLQDNTVYVATNNGALHAINPLDGTELFTFMPTEELAKTERRYTNPVLSAGLQRSTYGLDGGITVWRKARTDGSGEAEHVILYLGQRRGGDHYYALDVTDRSAPKTLWSITGGSTGFEKLGDTWSQPVLTQVLINGIKIPVLVFGGGYDESAHDDIGSVSTGDTTGNAIYVVNAYNGELIWSASNAGADINNPDMDWAISSKVSVVDINNDGVADYFYLADLGGQIFRADLNQSATSGSTIAVRVITLAALGTSESGAAGISDHRRFYSAPSVAINRRPGGEVILQLAIGSGYRAHPLDEQTSDRIFVIDDVEALSALVSGYVPGDTLNTDDLLDVTNNLAPTPDDFDNLNGWYITLEPGEKVLASPSIVSGNVFISTYLPESDQTEACASVLGTSRLYAVDLLNGSPGNQFLNNDGTFSRYKDIQLAGLPPSPQILVGSDGELVVVVGTATPTAGTLEGGSLNRTRWYELDNATQADTVLSEAQASN